MAGASEPAAAGLLNLEKELVCFICTEVLYQPLTLIDCLHTFCGSCVKEWFSHQHRKALQSRSSSIPNPYTCPTCRATVKDAKQNATVTTLLEMFLTANPSRGRSADEKEEMSRNYRIGDDILPRIEQHRRRERRSRREEEEAETHERRLVEEARERSMRDMRGGHTSGMLTTPSERHEGSRSRDREERRERRREQERAEARRRRAETFEAVHAQEPASQPMSTVALPPSTSPRHPDAVEARQRERTVAHQASLRSLVSASEGSTGTGDSLSEARIMQEILAEGFLEGINVDELTEAEQDVLSERIAELYRQRHPRNEQPHPPTATPSQPPRTSRAPTDDRQVVREQVVARTRQQSFDEQPRHRSRSSNRSGHDFPRSEEEAAVARVQPRNAEAAHNLSPPPASRVHIRRTSDQTRRQTSPTPPSTVQPHATRSATDLSRTEGPEARTVDRIRGLSDTRRTNTEPAQPSPKASEVWRYGGVDMHRREGADAAHTDSPARDGQSSASPRIRIAHFHSAADRPPLAAGPAPTGLRSEPIPTLATTMPPAPRPFTPPLRTPSLFREPFITCTRCSRPDIQYEIHKHCSTCSVDLCLRCYREGRGCEHWFGFGNARMAKFEASGPSRNSKVLELPHVLVGRQYLRPSAESIKQPQPQAGTSSTSVLSTSSDPVERLQEGQFCDRCGSFANMCFWSCDYCNEGEWGFCNDCVDSHHCCTHPLLPVARKSAPKDSLTVEPSADYDTRESLIARTSSGMHANIPGVAGNHSRLSTLHSSNTTPDDSPDFLPLRINASCDLCSRPIPHSDKRYHCPSHSSSTDKHNLGGFDVCTVCYINLVRSGRIKRDDGHHGWRKCPSGHRMIVVNFDTDEHGNQQRVVVNDLVGGRKCTEEDMASWKAHTAASMASGGDGQIPAPAGSLSSAGRWSWREDSSGTRTSRTRTNTVTSRASSTTSSFPPDGGFGGHSLASWSYYPEEGEEGRGELMFPKGAEVTEVEDINGEWFEGMYMGEIGVFPGVFVREIPR